MNIHTVFQANQTAFWAICTVNKYNLRNIIVIVPQLFDMYLLSIALE